MRALVAAEIRRGRRRVVAPAVAIGIAVAFVTLTFGATSALKDYLFRAVAARATLSDVVVSDLAGGGGSRPVPGDLVARVAAVPGVATAEPQYGTVVQVGWADGGDWTSVASVPAEPRLRWMRATAGRLPAGPGEVAVDATSARDLHLVPGATLQVTSDGTPQRVTVVGVADLGASPNLGGFRTLLAAPSVVAGWSRGGPLEIDVLAAPGTDPAVLRDRVAAAVGAGGGGAAVRTGQEQAAAQAKAFSRGVDVVGGFTLSFAAVALVVAMIVIANTFTAIFAQRARSLALLRCLGATRRQVFRAVLAETTLVGALASLGGVLAGAGLTALGLAVLGAIFPSMAGVGPGFAWWMLAVPFAVGVLVSLVAGVLPARRATRVAPLAALRPQDVTSARRASRLRVAAGALAALAGTGLLALGAGPLAGPGGLLVGLAGGTVSLFGVLLAGPVLVPALVRLAGLAVRGWVPGRIAVGNAVRNPVRAASTSVALFLGVALVTMMSVGAASATGAADRAVQRQYPLDVSVAAPRDGAVPASAVTGLARLAGTATSVALPGGTVTAAGPPPAAPDAARPGAPDVAPDVAPDAAADRRVDVVGTDPAGLARVWRGGDPGLRDGVALVPGIVAARLGLADGGPLHLGGAGAAGATFRVRVESVPRVVVTATDLARLVPGAAGGPVRVVLLRARDGADPSAFRTAVRGQVTAVPGVETGGSVTQRATVADTMEIMLRVVVALLAAAVLIAVVGIANTLALSVLERSRELAVQRALGMTRRQLRASLTAEALLLAVVGAVLGVVLGTGYGWAGARAIFGSAVDQVPLVVPWGRVAVMALVAAAAGALASVLPGRRAARTAPAAALAAE